MDWLLDLAVTLKCGHKAEKYKDAVSENTKKADSPATNVEPLIIVDVNNADFKAGIMTLADLQIQSHQDHLVMLKATCCLLQEHLTQAQSLKQTRQQKGGMPVFYRSTDFD